MRIVTVVAVVVLAAGCSSSGSKPALLLPPPVATTTSPAAVPATSAQPSPTAPPTVSAAAKANQAACKEIDGMNDELVTFIGKLQSGSAPGFGAGVPIMKAYEGTKAAMLSAPASATIGPDVTAFGDALQALDKKMVGPASGGSIDVSNEVATVERAWLTLGSSCYAAGYTLVNVAP